MNKQLESLLKIRKDLVNQIDKIDSDIISIRIEIDKQKSNNKEYVKERDLRSEDIERLRSSLDDLFEKIENE